MDCPKCTATMEKVVFENITVNRCTGCKGIWFDHDKQEALKQLKDSESIDTGDPEKGKQFNKIDKIYCPVCNTPMIRMVDYQQPHIWYESCATCYGLFFDAGEFTDYKNHTPGDLIKDLKIGERK